MPNDAVILGWRKRWNRSLLRFIGRRVPSRGDIEDLAQETYLRLLRARDLGTVRNPQAYLLGIASHIISEWRHRQMPAGPFSAVDEESLSDESLPELSVEADLSRALLERTLQEMAPMTRAVMVLRFREERRCEDIARELGLTDRQVRRHLTRGYERLRSAMMT
jgi:RNA polymerase sigma-70 factor (ECF subfamily)